MTNPDAVTVHEPIPDFEPRSAPPSGAIPLFVSILLIVAGLAIAWAALGGVPQIHKTAGVPTWIIGSVGGIFAVAGLFILIHVVVTKIRSILKRRRWDRYPTQPWMVDYEWDSSGASSSPLGRGLREMMSGIFMGIFLTPFNWVSILSEAPWFFRLPFGLITMLFNLMALGLLSFGFRRVFSALRHGSTSIRFARFPFRPGERVDLIVSIPRTEGPTFSVELRCVEERIETDGESSSIVGYCLHSESKVVPQSGPFGSSGPHEAHVSFDVPIMAVGTALSARPPRYWEAVVRPDAGSSVYTAKVLIPIYVR